MSSKEYYMQQILPVLFALANKIQTNCDKIFKPVTTRQFMALMTLVHTSEEKSTIQFLSQQMGTSKQNMAQLVQGLEKNGIISLLDNPADKRSKLIHLTDEGLKITKDAVVDANKIINDMNTNFSEKELKEFYRLLLKLFGYDAHDFVPFHK